VVVHRGEPEVAKQVLPPEVVPLPEANPIPKTTMKGNPARKKFQITEESKTVNFPVKIIREYWDKAEKILKTEIPYKNGKKHGAFKEFYKTGELMKTGIFVNGKPNGDHITYFESQAIFGKITWTDGELGYQVGYYETGELEGEVNRESGVLNGPTTTKANYN